MQTKSSRIRMAGYCAAALGLIALAAHVSHFQGFHHGSVAKTAGSALATVQAPSKSAADWAEAMRKSPLTFQANQGQTDPQVRYVSHGYGYELFLTQQEAVIALQQTVRARPNRAHRIPGVHKALRSAKTSVVRLELDGANKNAEVTGVNLLPGHVNYFIGNDAKNWRTNVPSYSGVKYTGVYPGIDLVFYGNQRHLEYDLVVAPGADPSRIAFDISGAKKLDVNAKGNLVMTLAKSEVELQKPTIYQERDGRRVEIAGNYVVSGNRRVNVAISKYDPAQPLVIDPVLDYSTFLGGSADDMGNGIAVDKSGNAYVAGTTMSTDFPTTATAFQGPPPQSTPAAFVTELNPTGTKPLVNSTYLSGNGGEEANAIALDATGNIYVAGETFSTNFPTTGSAFSQSPIVNPGGTAFLTVINGSSLVYSTYLGGTAGDFANGVAADANGQAYIAGAAFPSSFTIPGTAGTFTSTLTNAAGSAFLARIDTTKTGTASLIYYTFLTGTGTGIPTVPGTSAELASAIAVDTTQNAYVTGYTTSSDFPTTANGYVQAPFSGAANGVVFVSEVNTATTGTASLVYSGYLAGTTAGQNLGDFGFGIALGPNNAVYVDGTTTSADFPTTTGAFETTIPSPVGAAFVSLINTSASGTASLTYSTFFGAENGETATGIAVDSTGVAYVSGNTGSAQLPVSPGAFQATRLNNTAPGDGFVLKLNPGGNGASDRLYASYLGGSGDGTGDTDFLAGIAIDSNNNAYLTGQAISSDFPHSAGVFQTALNGPSDAFVTELGLVATLNISPNPVAFGTQLVNTPTPAMTVTVTNNSTGALPTVFSVVGANAADFVASPGAATGCGPTLAAGASCTIGVVFTPTVVAAESAMLQIANSGTPSQPFAVLLTGTGSATGAFTVTAPATFDLTSGMAGSVPVTVTGSQGFTGMVNLTCTGNTPNVTSCTMMPTSVTVTSGTTSPTAVAQVIATVSFVAPPASIKTPPSVSLRQVVFLVLGISMLFMIPMTQRLRLRLGMVAAMLVFVAVAGCSNNGKSHTGTGSITITGTAPGTPALGPQSASVNLTISQ
jgi:Beta-propeller repeat